MPTLARELSPATRWQLLALADDGDWSKRDPAPMEMQMYPHRRKTATFGWKPMGALESNIPADQYYEPPHPQGITPRESGLIVNGSDSVQLVATAELNLFQRTSVHRAAFFTLTFRMPLDRGDHAVTHQITLQHVTNPPGSGRGEIGRWVARPE